MLNDWWFTPIWGSTATPVEIVWVVISLVGISVALINFYHTHRTVNYLDETHQNGLLRFVGTTQLKQEAIRVCVQAIFLSIGLIAVLFNPGETGGKIIAWLIVAASLLIVVKSILSARSRNQVINYEEVTKHEEKKGG